MDNVHQLMFDFNTPPTKDEERFWAKVDKTSSPNGCWLWTACVVRGGYGLFGYRGKGGMAHRFAWELLRGPIPEGLILCHNCPGGDNPACVNPAHLWLGTTADNMRDRLRKGHYASGDEHPLRVHPERIARGERCGAARLTEENVLEIRRRRELGEPLKKIAVMFSITETTVSEIALRRTWKHVA